MAYKQVEVILDEKDSKERVRCIQSVLNAEEKKWRARLPWLAHHDIIASTILASTLAVMGSMWYLYLNSYIPWYVASLVCAMCLGVHHELEHDIIHNLYFKNNKLVQDIWFAILFMTKFHISPWIRRQTHWKHHRVSGQLNDVEERFVGMGEPFGIRRLFLAVHPASIYTQITRIKDDAPQFDFAAASHASIFPFGTWQIVTKLWLMYHVVAYLNPANPYGNLPQFLYPLLTNALVLWLIPSMLRSSSLIILTSNSHFYADIPKNNLFYQCQILNHPLVFFFALFTVDFGATHIVHHYNALQPFYLRQLCRGAALEEMRKQGVRENDWGVILRGNSFHRDPKNAAAEKRAFFAYIFLIVALCPVWLVLGDISFLSQFVKDKVTRRSLQAEKGSSEYDDNDNKEVKCD